MITTRTKAQLLVFVVLTVLGVAYVGAKYAKIDRLIMDTTYEVAVEYVESGGIFVGSEVTYRGVRVGQVSDMRLSKAGVIVELSIEKGHDTIPADTLAIVANKSAIGEQYVDLQPQTDAGPYLADGSTIPIANTRVPVSTTEILTNTDNLLKSIPVNTLRTVVAEMGAAFKGVGPDIGKIIDTSNEFIQAANDNFEVTTALIRDSNVVLRSQAAKGSAIRSFAKDLDLFTGTLAANDPSLRKVIENGSATATELRTFLEQNEVDLGGLLNNLVTTGEISIKHIKGLRQALVALPYIVAGGFSVAGTNSDGTSNARFGLVLTMDPHACKEGYNQEPRRNPLTERENKPLNEHNRCTEPLPVNPRGAQHAPRTATGFDQAPIATWDRRTGEITWADEEPAGTVAYDGGAAELYGVSDSWQSLLLHPVAD